MTDAMFSVYLMRSERNERQTKQEKGEKKCYKFDIYSKTPHCFIGCGFFLLFYILHPGRIEGEVTVDFFVVVCTSLLLLGVASSRPRIEMNYNCEKKRDCSQ